MGITLTKAELEYYATARPRTSESPGYFKDGKFHYGPIYHAHLGTKGVGFADGFPSYVADAGGYWFRDDALKGAKAFQAKMRELLAAGAYSDKSEGAA